MSKVTDDYFLFPDKDGTGILFFFTDEEIIEVLNSSLLPEYGPYVVVTWRWDKKGKVYVAKTIDQFRELREEGYFHFYIISEKISGRIDISSYGKIIPPLETQGVILLDHGYISKNYGWYSSYIGHVIKSVNSNTGEERVYAEYEEICAALCRAIGGRLSYKAMFATPDGQTVKYDGVGMTRGFVDAIESGDIKTSFLANV